jgi:hypothetical protein
MKQPTKVVMLPTEIIHAIANYGNNLMLSRGSVVKSKVEQNVYITVSQDVEPIEDCWYYDHTDNKIEYCKKGHGWGKEIDMSQYSKIIATTDKTLSNQLIVKGKLRKNYHLPQLQQSFLKEFVANPDGEFEVNYGGTIEEFQNFCSDLGFSYDSSFGWYENNSPGHRPNTSTLEDKFNKTLKLNQDNTVNITSVEEKMYSGIDLMGNQDGSFDHFLLHSSKFSQEEREVIMDAVYDWIKINT